MMRKLALSAMAAVVMGSLAVSAAHAQKNYTDGGDLYGGAHAATGKAAPSKEAKKSSTQRSGKFDPYTDGVREKTASSGAKKFPDERPQPDDVARSGKFDPYSEGQSK
ncbi:hypothetical protein SAMN04488595_11830 [Ralstonia sp. 25mfcol4.1]|nr:hypothetical protein SAMN04488595_11830 [Ralstonia sp. 25mfcol4.1]